MVILGSKQISGSGTWNCTSIAEYKNLSTSNFYGCNISGTLHIYGSFSPNFGVSCNYNNSSGILTISIAQAAAGASMSPAANLTINPICIY